MWYREDGWCRVTQYLDDYPPSYRASWERIPDLATFPGPYSKTRLHACHIVNFCYAARSPTISTSSSSAASGFSSPVHSHHFFRPWNFLCMFGGAREYLNPLLQMGPSPDGRTKLNEPHNGILLHPLAHQAFGDLRGWFELVVSRIFNEVLIMI